MIRTQIYLMEKERAALQRLAAERGASQSALIREAVDLYLDDRSHEERLAKLRAARGMWNDRANVHATFRAIRESMDRNVQGPSGKDHPASDG
ncbi:ribbon-helix-helix domain-containing protein [Salisaeta longa]|uniref:ribbon-helix-helix domain-containing protein n=1 Tax=Salisaeta longa TaxID=503170 RepID=UPI0003B712B7|nr:CopG family transcriptional regulator [Salisaeta longa]